MIFQLYLLINTTKDSHAYPYIGIAEESNMHIHICQDHINLVAENDSSFNERDYFLTSRTVELDLFLVDSLIHDFIRQEDYELVTWFENEKCMAISYYRWPAGTHMVHHILEKQKDAITGKLIDNLYPIMEQLLSNAMCIE